MALRKQPESHDFLNWTFRADHEKSIIPATAIKNIVQRIVG
jgi:hypothetical protein